MMTIIVQNLTQLRKVYGAEGMSTILSNASSLLAYAGIRERETLDFISMLLGKTTKTVLKPTAFSSFAIERRSKNLLELDEIRTLDSQKGIFIHGNEQGQIIKPLPIFQNKALMNTNGIASIDGEMVVLEATKPLPSDRKASDYFSFPDLDLLKKETTQINEFEERLKEILP